MGKNKFYILGGIFLILAGFFVYKIFSGNQIVLKQDKFGLVSSNSSVEQQASALDGELVNSDVAQRRPIAVMVENHPDARPQSGLIGADTVYEAPTEGGITRFMAVYQTQKTDNVGPVRSARTYFAEIANELGAVYAHVGGNSDALQDIKNRQYLRLSDADQFFNDPYFQRIASRLMPHNVYTSISKLDWLIAAHNFSDTADFQPWQFKDDAPSASSSALSITVPFSESSYEVQWRYNPSSRSYLRYLAGLPHKDADTGRQISAKNVVVQVVQTFPVKSDTIGSIGMTLQGQGKAYIFEDGGVTVGVWKKTGDGRTRYYDSQNREISFDRGQIWVELLPQEQAQGLVWK